MVRSCNSCQSTGTLIPGAGSVPAPAEDAPTLKLYCLGHYLTCNLQASPSSCQWWSLLQMLAARVHVSCSENLLMYGGYDDKPLAVRPFW